MTEQNPDHSDNPALADDLAEVVTPDELSVVSGEELLDEDELMDAEDLTYPGAAEDNPDAWQDDPLVNEEPLAGQPGEMSDQTLRDETREERYEEGDSQVPPEEPTIGEAARDVDFGDPTADPLDDGSDDPAHAGGDPLSSFNPDDEAL
ncbi:MULTISPECIES: hypothetical protein [Arthrobacter]|uniref:DUF5709 domain-containing protein n=1 Tax=Arthrobacter caoxuetaonis TaxID=2886935 RepID=A0A9X1ME32_9MICC|nr:MULTISPECIES: hypothetical protein [Arthrobacter]MCC3283246.1 hypothetical protein [Arthrobacter caoxuetaonis]MCC3298368.1 hypothetical protein [Arthrobacter caoxuetaonis]MCC9195128.1 hypothetical protein [Arthrobacter sp. zg-Y916]USQ57615.1 hypothetical protein NF551_01750 [Arthrobacter caoxuetaonis]